MPSKSSDSPPLQSEFSSSGRCLPDKVFVLYASQTGQAESISEFIFDLFTSGSGALGFVRDRLGDQAIQRHCTSNYEAIIEDFLQPKNSSQLRPGSFLAIVVVSTTGQGDPPDKANKFFRWIRRLSRTNGANQVLSHLSYALLGLGDTNYDNFANFGHLLDRHFTELGARQYVTAEYADDAVGLELVTEPFIDNITQTLSDHFSELPLCDSLTIQETTLTVTEIVEQVSESKKIPIVQQSQSKNNSMQSTADESNRAETETFSSCLTEVNDCTMNFTHPVVSSCNCLSSSDKQSLSDLCRQLIEPSESMKTLSDTELLIPNVTFSPNQSLDCLQFNGSSEISNELESKLTSIYDFLKSKVLKEMPLYEAQVKFNKKLSSTLDSSKLCCHKEKTVIECDVLFKPDDYENQPEFTPGDAFGIYSSNLLVDVYQVLMSVLVKSNPKEDFTKLWDFLKITKKRVLVTLNEKTVVELMPYLVFGVDLRTNPKKQTLAHFAKFTTDPQQKRRLLELCSRQGNLEYQKLIPDQRLTICEILRLFPSCNPPISVFLHYLTPSRPRYFSAASIPKHIDDSTLSAQAQFTHFFRIMFSITNNFTHSFMRTSEQLLGLFSGKFFQHYPVNENTLISDYSCSNIWKTLQYIDSVSTNGTILDNQDVPLMNSSSPFPVYIFPRVKSFQVTSDVSKPLIFISTGTGIAPFLSFIEQRKRTIESSADLTFGEVYFFFGCRHPYQDFTYANELLSYSKGDPPLLKHLCLCFSRCKPSQLGKFELEHQISLCNHDNLASEENDKNHSEQTSIKHVNELVELHGEELTQQIVEKDAHVYICGVKKISKVFFETFSFIMSKYYLAEENPSSASFAAAKYLKELQNQRKYVVDVWG